MQSKNILKIHAAAAALLAGLSAPALAQQAVDTLITGGTVYDGSDAKPYIGDVAISGDRIVAVGPVGRTKFNAKRTVNAKGLIVSPGFIDGHSHANHFLNDADPKERQAPAYLTQGVSTVILGIDGGGTPEIKDQFAKWTQAGIGVNTASYVGYGTIRSRVIGDEDRAPTSAELATEKALVSKGMCEGALGLSAGLFYAPQSYAKTGEVIELAKEAAKRGGIYDTHQRDESTYSIGLMASTREVLQIGRAANIPVHFSHIKALGTDVWGKSVDVIKLIDDARASGQKVTANQYPWLASHTGLAAAIVPRWVQDGGYAAMIKRFNDPAQMPKIKKELGDNLRRRNGPHAIFFSDKGQPWTGKYLDEVAKDWKVEPVDAIVRILRQTQRQSIVSFNMTERDLDNFMKQSWVVTSSDGGEGHPREWATFPVKWQHWVQDRKVISPEFFIRHSTGLAADIYMLDKRGYLRPGYYADVVVFNANTYRPKADYLHIEVPSTGVQQLLVNGRFAIDNGKMTAVLSGKTLSHTPTPGSCL